LPAQKPKARKTKPRKPKARRPKPKPQPQRLVRNSELSNFRRCRWQWAQGYVNRLKPIQEHPALRFGTLIHAALELRYPPGKKRGPKPAETFEELFTADLRETERTWKTFDAEEEWEDALELGIDMLEGFVKKYGRDEEWEVIESEMTFKAPVYLPPELELPPTLLSPHFDPSKPLFWFVGTMDGVWRSRMDGRVRIIDWKTTRNDPIREGAGKTVLDEQATAYWTWGVDALIEKGVLKPRMAKELDGMLYTFLRKAKEDIRPENSEGLKLNQDGTVSKKQPVPRFHRELVYRTESDRERARVRAVYEYLELLTAERHLAPVYKNIETGQTGHCSWCPFRDICELHEAGADWETMRDVTMEKWDPYAAHEIAEEGKR
jgi:Zierdtviridae exonuclease